jgi:hypothetical protein
MFRSILLLFVCWPLVWAQAVLTSPSHPLAVPTGERNDLIDKALGIAGPSEPRQLTERARFHLYLLSVVGPVPLLAEAGGAAISQAMNSPRAWGQGWGPFGERFESNLAYNGIRQSITYGTSVVFHEDNRYFSSHQRGFWRRAGYAVRSTVTARHPDGMQGFSISSVAGVFGASGLSSIWGPRTWEGAEGIGRNAGTSFALTAGFNIVREFLPDLLHHPQ